MEYDLDVLEVFLEKQLQLFPEKVANSPEEAEEFLNDCFSMVVDSAEEAIEYLEDQGYDMEDGVDGLDGLADIEEVFDIGDGRYLIVEG